MRPLHELSPVRPPARSGLMADMLIVLVFMGSLGLCAIAIYLVSPILGAWREVIERWADRKWGRYER